MIIDPITAYFAYGSNMSSPRLQQRVGAARVVGPAWLEGHRHSFSKRGRDGTAKGNIEPAPGQRVWGVVYELDADQLERLAGFESGYGQVTHEVCLVEAGTEPCRGVGRLHAASFEALMIVRGLEPSAAYLAHYLAGLHEHGGPAEYGDALLHGLGHLAPG